MKKDYFTQLTRAARWLLPPEEAREVLAEYRDILDAAPRDDESLRVKEDFLKTNANYFGAEIKKTPFNKKTVDEINSWVDKNTDGMIKEIVNELSPDEVMHLINAVAFEAGGCGGSSSSSCTASPWS